MNVRAVQTNLLGSFSAVINMGDRNRSLIQLLSVELYLKAVSDSCQTLPDPRKLAHDLKVYSFRFFENAPRGSRNTPNFGIQRLFLKTHQNFA